MNWSNQIRDSSVHFHPNYHDQFSYLAGAYHHVKRRRVMLALVQATTKIRSVHLVCDVGCGDGWYSLPLSRLGYHVVGIDVSRGSLRRAKMRVKNADFIRGDANAMPFRSKIFDFTICAQVLEHMRCPSTVVGECKIIGKHGGFFLFEVPSKSNLVDMWIKRLLGALGPWTTWGLTIDAAHIHFFTQEELKEIFADHNLTLVEVIGAVALRYSLPVLSQMFFNAKMRFWNFLDLVEGLISSIPTLKKYGAIQSFLLTKK